MPEEIDSIKSLSLVGYQIQGLFPSDDLNDKFGFIPSIPGEVAKFALGLKVGSGGIRDDFYEDKTQWGIQHQRKMIRAFGHLVKRGVLLKEVNETPYEFVEGSCLLSKVNCWGMDASDIGLDYEDIQELRERLTDESLKGERPVPVYYHSHNVNDPIKQLVLLGLWQEWANGMCSAYRDRSKSVTS